MLLVNVTHTFKFKGPKLGNWSKWTCITLEGCFCSLLTSNWEVNTGRFPYSFISFLQIKKNFVFSSYIEDNETNLPIEKHTLRVLYNLKKMFAKFGFDASFMCLQQLVAFCVTFNELCSGLLSHTFVDNIPNLADWSKRVCITLRSYFCNLLTSNWEVSTGRSFCSLISFDQITQNFVLSSFIKDIATNLPFGKHTLRVFTWYFEEIVGKNLLAFFIYMFVSICCMLGHFQGFMLLNETFRLAVTYTFKGSGPKLADWSKWIRITLRSCFCNSLTANWEVSTARSLYIFINFVQLQ